MRSKAWFKSVATILGVTLGILALSILIAQLLHCWFRGELAAWVQAVGAILAIVTGFATAAFQARSQEQAAIAGRNDLARAAHTLAFEALETISERLEAALTPSNSSKRYALRGDRTTEMISAMREFYTVRLPTDMVSDFIQLRSHVYAINQRISEIYGSEEHGALKKRRDAKAKRNERLESSVRVRSQALDIFQRLQILAVERYGVEAKSVSSGGFLTSYDPHASGVELADRSIPKSQASRPVSFNVPPLFFLVFSARSVRMTLD